MIIAFVRCLTRQGALELVNTTSKNKAKRKKKKSESSKIVLVLPSFFTAPILFLSLSLSAYQCTHAYKRIMFVRSFIHSIYIYVYHRLALYTDVGTIV
jgi:hypothetical protein